MRAWLALLPLTSILAASCTTLSRGPVDRRYEVILDHTTTGGGPGASLRRHVSVTAEVVERRTAEQLALTVQKVTATGDPADVASARSLEGATVTVGPESEVAFGGRLLSSPLSVVDTALLSQVLVSMPADERAPSTAYRLYLPVKDARFSLSLRQEMGASTQHRDARGKTVSVTAGGSKEMVISAFQASSDGSNRYVAQSALVDLIGPAPSQPFDTALRGRGNGDSGIPRSSLSRLFGCLFGSCPPLPPRTRPRAGAGQEIVVVNGPRSLDVKMSEKIDIKTTGLVEKAGKRLLQSNTTGQSTLTGTLPVGAGVPPELEGKPLQAASTWTAKKTLLPGGPGPGRRSLAQGLALVMLFAVAVATGVMAVRRRWT